MDEHVTSSFSQPSEYLSDLVTCCRSENRLRRAGERSRVHSQQAAGRGWMSSAHSGGICQPRTPLHPQLSGCRPILCQVVFLILRRSERRIQFHGYLRWWTPYASSKIHVIRSHRVTYGVGSGNAFFTMVSFIPFKRNTSQRVPARKILRAF